MTLQPFNQHDDQADWAALTLELLDQGMSPLDAGELARHELEATRRYAAEWDAKAARARQLRRLLSIIIAVLAVLVVGVGLAMMYIRI